jgi:cyclic pyranopterin phosphate synthase
MSHEGRAESIAVDSSGEGRVPLDRFGREISYLRLSVIDHCNLRCVYCMPLRGLSFVPAPELLTAAEIETVVRAAVGVGFRKFRLTGGEPTLRADILEITRRVASVPGVEDLAMTSNGILLPRLARPLKEAGLKRLNLHVDTLHPERLQKLMRFGSLEEIEAGIAAAEDAGLLPIKINCVVTRDYNDTDVVDLARRALDGDWHVRFIELMPLGGGETAHVALSQFVPTAETRRRIEADLGPLLPVPGQSPSDEARNHRFANGQIGRASCRERV